MNFWDFFWLMLWGFVFISYLMVLFQVIGDVFRDPGLNGWVRAVWLIALFVAPPVTALVYILVRGRGMAQRRQAGVDAVRASKEEYIRSVAGEADPTAQLVRAKSLLDDGAISAEEYTQLKAKALS
ncbi:MAG: SHOCT domain-containing protein [Propionibacteriaceae bacterium]|nr:SHOCT domain-containing protein [Propionibacteriaceae bacterium]